MSTTNFIRAGLIATVGIAGLTLSANAQSRYGNVYDYESGRNCGQACVPAAPAAATNTSARYGAPVQAYSPAPAYNPAPVYVDCVQAGTCAPQPSVVYTQPAQTYSQPTYTQPAQTYSQPTQTYTQSTQLAPVNCPAGTTAQSDGTCMQGSSYSSSTTYASDSYSSDSYSAPTTSLEPVNCPSGTTAQSDGTCMQTGSSYSSGTTYSSGSTSSYSSDSYSSDSYASTGAPTNCPAGTTAQSDGTCMQGGSNAYAGTSVELYTGDTSAASTGSSSYGYGSSNTYSSTDYLPIRK